MLEELEFHAMRSGGISLPLLAYHHCARRLDLSSGTCVAVFHSPASFLDISLQGEGLYRHPTCLSFCGNTGRSHRFSFLHLVRKLCMLLLSFTTCIIKLIIYILIHVPLIPLIPLSLLTFQHSMFFYAV